MYTLFISKREKALLYYKCNS